MAIKNRPPIILKELMLIPNKVKRAEPKNQKKLRIIKDNKVAFR